MLLIRSRVFPIVDHTFITLKILTCLFTIIFEFYQIRAVPRLQIIGSPRGAAEKFDAKRVIGAAFF